MSYRTPIGMKKHILIVILVVVALVLSISVAAAANSRTVFRAPLRPSVDSDGHGNAVVKFRDDGSEFSYKLIVNGLEDPIMAHIHVAATPGGNGPPVLWLYPDAPPPQEILGVFNGLLGSGNATSADLTGEAGITSLDDLRAAVEEGRAYVNIHTMANPGGEIRGTLK